MNSSERPEMPPSDADKSENSGIQTSSALPSSPESIPLPPLPKPRVPTWDADTLRRQRGALDAILIALVLGFAFLTASFPAGNSDFFRQIATGRLLLQGDFHFGQDPFVFSSDGKYWVHHSWFYAIVFYLLYQFGGVVVVVFKALLIAGLAEITLQAGRRRGRSLWIPASCTLLALLTVSQRVYLQPICFSYVFLALTIWLLLRPHSSSASSNEKDNPAPSPSLRSWWLLPPLFALWVNCDEWFFLGPLSIVLYLAGLLIQRTLPTTMRSTDQLTPKEIGQLGWVLAVGLAACLLNPYHVRAFTLPVELGLSPTGTALENDPQFFSLFLSPFRKAFYNDPSMGQSVAGLSYFPLIGLGLVSFGFLYRRLDVSRLLLWMGFFLLSALTYRAVPFFAIVAGPITALNWLDSAEELFGPSPRTTSNLRLWSLGGRVLTILTAVVLLVLTVPGWLQTQPRSQRRIGWDVRVDPALEEAARAIHEWRKEHLLPADPHWFSLHYEVANYLAWFAPGERAFLDQSLPSFPLATEDYLVVREGTFPTARETDSTAGSDDSSLATAQKDWRRILRKRKVRFWIVDNLPFRKTAIGAPVFLFADPDEWTTYYFNGRIAILGWNDPEDKNAPEDSQLKKLDFKNLAFGKEAQQAPQRAAPSVPTPRVTDESFDVAEVWEAWSRPAPVFNLDRDTAELHEIRNLALEQYQLTMSARSWQMATAASVVSLAANRGSMVNSLLALKWSSAYDAMMSFDPNSPTSKGEKIDSVAQTALMMHVSNRDQGLPDSLYLGLRAARRASLVNPADAMTHMLLAQIYQRFQDQPQERNARSLSPKLAELRRTQVMGEMQNCLRCLSQPLPKNSAEVRMALQAHFALYNAFEQMGYKEMQVHHLRETLRIRRAFPPPASKANEQMLQMLNSQDELLSKLEKEVQTSLNEYELAAEHRSPLEKVLVALESKLPAKAWNLFNQLDPEETRSQYGQYVVRRMMGLLLNLGWLDEAQKLIAPDPEETSHQALSPDYLDLHLRLAAARGDYEEADRVLADALNYSWKGPGGMTMNTGNLRALATMVGRVLLVEATRLAGVPRLPWVPNDFRSIGDAGQSPSEFWVRRWRMEALTTALIVQQMRCEWHLLRGWLALEAGHCIESRKHFQLALDEYVSEGHWVPEIQKLDALVEVPNQPSPERRRLENLIGQMRFLRSYALFHFHWLGVYQH